MKNVTPRSIDVMLKLFKLPLERIIVQALLHWEAFTMISLGNLTLSHYSRKVVIDWSRLNDKLINLILFFAWLVSWSRFLVRVERMPFVRYFVKNMIVYVTYLFWMVLSLGRISQCRLRSYDKLVVAFWKTGGSCSNFGTLFMRYRFALKKRNINLWLLIFP